MTGTQLAIVGGGPAGLSAAITAARLGASPLLIDDNPVLGGQLIKQTHKFFGSRDLYCGTRGIDIAGILSRELPSTVETLLNSTVVGFYPDNVLGVWQMDTGRIEPRINTGRHGRAEDSDSVHPCSPVVEYSGGHDSESRPPLTLGRFLKLKVENAIFATGAGENTIVFPGNDLPGVYGAGAVQTLMNVYGVRPGTRVLMVGAGNIGLIVSYQLIQAGIEVACVVDVLPKIGGYHVHAAKLARLEVPILTSHTVVEALGKQWIEGAVIARVGPDFRVVPGTRRRLKLDTICLAVGLSPLAELLWQAGCRMVYVPELGGNVPWHDANMQTSKPGIYVAGDLSGIEEASTAMLEGRLAGVSAAERIKGSSPESTAAREAAITGLGSIRQGPFGEKAACGKARLGAHQSSDQNLTTATQRPKGKT